MLLGAFIFLFPDFYSIPPHPNPVSIPIMYMLVYWLCTYNYHHCLPSSIAVIFSATIIQPPSTTCPIVVTIVIFIIPTCHSSRSCPLSWSGAFSFDVCCVNCIVNSIFLQSIFKFLSSTIMCKKQYEEI